MARGAGQRSPWWWCTYTPETTPDWDIRMRRLAQHGSLMTRWATSWLGPRPWTSVQAGTPWPKRYATKGSAVRLPQPSQLRPRSEEHTSELQSRFDLVC